MSAVDKLHDADLEIREALPDDAHAIAALYVWHVLNGRASFEEIPPTVDEMRKRIKTVRDSGLPWLVALWRGTIVGYCYATFYRPRPAYRYTLEESIYVEAGMRNANRDRGGRCWRLSATGIATPGRLRFIKSSVLAWRDSCAASAIRWATGGIP